MKIEPGMELCHLHRDEKRYVRTDLRQFDFVGLRRCHRAAARH